MPPSKTRGGTGRRRMTSPKAQLKTIKKTPRMRNVKIPAEALSTPLTPGWTRGTPTVFTLMESNLEQLPVQFENRRMTRRSSVYWTKQMLSTKSRATVSTVKSKNSAVIGRITVIQKTSSPASTRGRRQVSVCVPPPRKSSKSSKDESSTEVVKGKSVAKTGLSNDTSKTKKPTRKSEVKEAMSVTKKISKLKSSPKRAAEKPADIKDASVHKSPSTGKRGKKSIDSAEKKSNRLSKKMTASNVSLNNATPEVLKQSADERSTPKESEKLAASGKLLRSKVRSASTSQQKNNLKTPNADVSKESSRPTHKMGKTVSPEMTEKWSTKKQKTPRLLISKVDEVMEQSSLSIRSAKKVRSANDSVDASVLKSAPKHRRNKENHPGSVELVSPATEVRKNVKVARVRKVSMVMPDVDSPVNGVLKSAKRRIVKTPFKAAKLLGKNESPTGNTPQKAARILGKLDYNTNLQKKNDNNSLLTSTPLRSAHKRPADRPLLMSEIGKRALLKDQEGSPIMAGKEVKSMVVSDPASPDVLKMRDASATDLHRSTDATDGDGEGWWGWVCQIL